MKKTTVIVIAFIALVTAIVGGLLVVKFILGKRYDFVLTSIDGNSSFCIREICKSEPVRNMGFRAYTAELADPESFFENCVCEDPCYLYSVDSENRESKSETGNYLFFKDNSYYYLSVRDGKIYGCDLALTVWYYVEGDQYGAYSYFPFIKRDSHIQGGYGDLGYETTKFTWKEAPGIGSFDELVDFFKRIQDFPCVIDADAKTITVPLIDNNAEGQNLIIGKAVMVADEDGVTLIPEINP